MADLCCAKNNKTGNVYWLHCKKDPKGRTLYHFKRDIVGAIPLPEGYEVCQPVGFGAPYIRRKDAQKKEEKKEECP